MVSGAIDAITPEIEHFFREKTEIASRLFGYPITVGLVDFTPLSKFLNCPFNNAGGPRQENNCVYHTKRFEREVLDFYAKLWHLDGEWNGYITNGGTESNIRALLQAKQMFPGSRMFASDQSHHSVWKGASMLNIEYTKIPSTEKGEIQYDKMEELLIAHNCAERPPIIVATVGTTITGAVDNVERIVEILRRCNITNYYLHVDAALFGNMLPFLPKSDPIRSIVRRFDFSLPINSMCTCAHKFIGVPIAASVLLFRSSPQSLVAQSSADSSTLGDLPEYLKGTTTSRAQQQDVTISTSRTGLAPLFVWYAIQVLGKDDNAGFKQAVSNVYSLRNYMVEQFESRPSHDYYQTWALRESNIVVFRKPLQFVCDYFQLATDNNQAHVVLSPTFTRQKIDDFVSMLDTVHHIATKGMSRDSRLAFEKTIAPAGNPAEFVVKVRDSRTNAVIGEASLSPLLSKPSATERSAAVQISLETDCKDLVMYLAIHGYESEMESLVAADENTASILNKYRTSNLQKINIFDLLQSNLRE